MIPQGAGIGCVDQHEETQRDEMSCTACHLQHVPESPSISLSYYTSALRRHRVASHPRFIFDRSRFPPLLGR